MPHEIFMTAVVADADAAKARSVLTGATESRERHRYTKIRHMWPATANPPPKTLDKLKELGKEPRNPNAPRWQELHQILVAQSYTLQERVDVTAEVEALKSGNLTAPPTVAPTKPRTLRWDNFPDPKSGRIPPFLLQRRVLEITDRNVPSVMADVKFIPKSGALGETYHWWHNNLEYVLTKVNQIPPEAVSDETAVPDPASVTPVGDFWLLEVRAQVESKPELIQGGQDRMAQAQQMFLGVFEFKEWDRRVFDTRIVNGRN